jgi:hypothetical protein
MGKTDRLFSYDTTRTAQKTTPPTIILLLRYLLPQQREEGTHTDWREGFMKYAVGMGSGAMIYIPSFIKTGSGIQSRWGGHSKRHRQRDIISLLSIFYQNKESRLKTLQRNIASETSGTLRPRSSVTYGHIFILICCSLHHNLLINLITLYKSPLIFLFVCMQCRQPPDTSTSQLTMWTSNAT